MYNKDFLRQLDQDRHRIIYAKIIAMNFNEQELEEVDGVFTGGSINIDGKSSTRRSISLTMMTESIDLSKSYWYLNTKFKVLIGLENHIDNQQPDIIWFNQGIYIITDFSYSLSGTNYNVNITGKDKMCLLDGTIGGTLNCTVDFGKFEQEETLESGETISKLVKQPIKTIIVDAVHQYAGEPYQNIIVNDIPDIGLELQEYRYNTPLYLWRKTPTSNEPVTSFLSGTINQDTIVYYQGNRYSLKNLPNDFIFDPLNSAFASSILPSSITFSANNSQTYYLAKFDAGETIGYKQTLLVYPDDLIENAGANITTLLEKIKNFLGNFEYFYDTDGRFIFQKKKTYESESWKPFAQASYDISAPTDSQYSYKFINSSLFTAINHSPSLRDIRNDFTVWGEKNSVSGIKMATHMRVAIDDKPYRYTSISVSEEDLNDYNQKYGLNLKPQSSVTYVATNGALKNGVSYSLVEGIVEIKSPAIFDSYNNQTVYLKSPSGIYDYSYLYDETARTLHLDLQNFIQHNEYQTCDWRELIYQMAKDYNKYGRLDNFTQKILEANPQFAPSGKTGYEQYYIDIEGFWRTLYKPIDAKECYQVINSISQAAIENQISNLENLIKLTSSPEQKASLYTLLDDWNRKLRYYTDNEKYYYFTGKAVGEYEMITDEGMLFWARDIIENPSNLIFWFDFLDTTGELSKFSVANLGARPKVEVKNNNVRAIAYTDTPELLISAPEFNSSVTQNYPIINLNQYEKMIAKSSQGVSAKEAIDTLIFNYIYTTESISLTGVPIYYLEPNTRIYIEDEGSKLKGDYIINTISLPLTYNGTMSLSAIKAPVKIF